jgi:hypothetical protein
MKRVVLHELGHAVLGLSHDGQGESNTVMGSITPWNANTGWTRREWLRCDQARAQLLWGARVVAGPIANCFDHVSGAGANGLNTVVTISVNPTVVCVGESYTVSGGLDIATSTSYGRLSGDPLGSRMISIRRDGAIVAQPMTGATSGNYTATVSAGGVTTDAVVSSFANEGTEALTGDTSPTVTVTVLPPGGCDP